jgi:Na+-translocating ferredoxin:NAD+ oxidoreductase RnfD subunit
LITCILAVSYGYYGIGELLSSPLLNKLSFGLWSRYPPTFVAIAVTILIELILGRLVTGRWPHLASACISGLSVGILVRSPHLWPYVVCALITITSKYAIRVGGRHLWNPSNLGITVMVLLAPDAMAPLSVQFSNQIWPILVIWCLGALILWRLGRLHICVTYVAAFALLALVRSAVTGQSWLTEMGPITGPVYQLFIFFMITDPRTTTQTKPRQCIVAVAVAVLETVFRLGGDGGVQDSAIEWFGPAFAAYTPVLSELAIHAPYYALFVVGPTANLIEIWWTRRQKACAAATVEVR